MHSTTNDPKLAPVPAALRSATGNRIGAHAANAAEELAAEAALSQLSDDLARSVAQGRLTLRTAQTLQLARLAAATTPRPPSRGLLLAAAIGFACTGAVLGVSLRWSQYVQAAVAVEPPQATELAADVAANSPSGISRAERLSLGAVDVARGPFGEVVRVTGANPQSTLDAYCAASAGCAPTPRPRIHDAQPTQPGLRFGVFHAVVDPRRSFAVIIRREPESRRWTLGDGKAVRMLAPDELPLGPAEGSGPQG